MVTEDFTDMMIQILVIVKDSSGLNMMKMGI